MFSSHYTPFSTPQPTKLPHCVAPWDAVAAAFLISVGLGKKTLHATPALWRAARGCLPFYACAQLPLLARMFCGCFHVLTYMLIHGFGFLGGALRLPLSVFLLRYLAGWRA